ncbi:MAG: hypothetical protein ACOCTU_04420 [Bacteroidota bacterium]
MKRLNIVLLLLILTAFACTRDNQEPTDIVIENPEMKLVLKSNGYAKSLIHKATGEELLAEETMTPLSEATFLRRHDRVMNWTEEKGDHLPRCEKNAEHRVHSSSVNRQGDSLLIGFEGVTDTLILGIDLTDHYLGLTIEGWKGKGNGYKDVRFLQLPVREKTRFGDWLNMMWDDETASGILGTDPRTRIQAERRKGYRVLHATAYPELHAEEAGAALLVANTSELLAHIEELEKDYGLPGGAAARQKGRYTDSYFWAKNVTPGNIGENIQIAKQAGFSGLMISYWSFTESAGHLEWNSDYPNGMEDMKEVTSEIRSAGLTPTFHIHYSKADKWDPYVKDTPDHRLNLRRIFTLSKPLSPGDTTVWVEEDPHLTTLDEERRILKVGNELIRYERYTTSPPYKFVGCERGVLDSEATSHPTGLKMGVLDVDTWTRFVRFDQRTSIQDEVAERVAELYNEGGFESIYYDGAEDIHSPDWYNTAKAQYEVHKKLDSPPLFGEGASYSHFSWHMLSRGNPWDTQEYKPEELKDAVRKESCAQAPRMKENFSLFTFVRLAYDLPSSNTIGIQPDHLEFVCSRAAAWDLPISIWDDLQNFKKHPLTEDNLEVVRNWEKVKDTDWLTEKQKQMLRNIEQEHILLTNEQEEFELLPYEQIENAAKGVKEIRAFIFERQDDLYVVYWHTLGKGQFLLPVEQQNIKAFGSLGGDPLPIKAREQSVVLPVGSRRYLEFTNLSKQQIIEAFRDLRLLPER